MYDFLYVLNLLYICEKGIERGRKKEEGRRRRKKGGVPAVVPQSCTKHFSGNSFGLLGRN
jgi:hypothetical protein